MATLAEMLKGILNAYLDLLKKCETLSKEISTLTTITVELRSELDKLNELHEDRL